MKTIAGLGIAVAVIVLGAIVVMTSVAGGGQARETVCHINGRGDVAALEISSKALGSHIDHGDLQPGDPVPGMPGYVFDNACGPLALTPTPTPTPIPPTPTPTPIVPTPTPTPIPPTPTPTPIPPTPTPTPIPPTPTPTPIPPTPTPTPI